MATHWWVGGGSSNTWAATVPTNWSIIGSGGAGGATVPTTTDQVVFDGGSGTGNAVIGASITVQGLECDGSVLGTGAYAGTITHNTGVTLTLNTGNAGTLRFASGMTYTPATTTSLITLTHTTGTANIKSNGKAMAALTINGVGGTTQTLDALLVNAVQNAILTVSNGIFDANGGAGGPFAITAILFVGTGSSTRSVILGSGVTIGGNIQNNQGAWNFGTTTLLTFTKNSANITVLGNSSTTGGWNFVCGGLSYNGITFNANSSQSTVSFTGSNTFSTFTLNTGWNLQFAFSTTMTITTAFTWTGTAANPILIFSSGPNAVCFISVPSGTCTLTWGGLQAVSVSGGAAFVATNTSNFGGNTGWSISPPADATVTPPAGTIAAMARGTVTTGGTTTSVPTSALTFGGVTASGVVVSQFVGRTTLFDGATTTAGLRGVSSSISASTASNTPTFTVGTLPATPASGDTFSVI